MIPSTDAQLILALSGPLLRILLILAAVLAVRRLAWRFGPRLTSMALRFRPEAGGMPQDVAEIASRRETLGYVFLRTIDVLLLLTGGFMLLSELGFNLAPLLASAGVVGIALGFGAQALVRDVLGGLFVLLEDQYRKGDVVQVAGVSGVVEDINLRRTVLRDLDGVVHSVPNGEIRVASNMTRGWSRVNLNVNVGYDQDLDKARATLDRVGAELAADPEWSPFILEPPRVLRVDAFEPSSIALKVLATTRPMKQWDVAGELRRRIKAAFDKEGIEIPYQRQVIMVRNGERDGAGVGLNDQP